MCGIVGFAINHKMAGPEVVEMEVLEQMLQTIVHRGPDGSGTYYDSQIALGHRRLSVIDLEGGTQPMKNEDGRFICVFNGEIYNYRELRQQLESQGHVFSTESDTEVLLHGYEAWEQKLPEKLRGMFAFAIWDKKEKELLCARDYFGIKPFYYYFQKDVFLFGSEIKSFLPHPQFQKKLHLAQLERYLTYQYSPGNETFFENVYKLPPAHWMRWKENYVEIKRYWQPVLERKCQVEQEMQANENTPKERESQKEYGKQHGHEWKNRIYKVLQESVNAHKVSDVEVGSFLSSGVDSTYITKMSGVDKTFSVGYAEDWYDEANLAYEWAENNGMKNQICRISKEEFLAAVPLVQYHMDEPLADASAVSLYFLNRMAAKQVKVCLSGEGADELFGGYNIYKEPFMCQRYDKLPLSVRRVLGGVAGLFPRCRGRNFLVRHGKDLQERYIGPTTLFDEWEKRRLLKGYSGKKDRMRGIGLENADHLDFMQLADIQNWLVGDILLKADKMSMANSVELRVPFLDKEVFQVASSLPVHQRTDKTMTKIALREAATTVIESGVAYREKRGFPVPLRDWLRQEDFAANVRKQFQSSTAQTFFNKRYLLNLLERHVQGKCDCWREIWCIYTFLVWHECYFGLQ